MTVQELKDYILSEIERRKKSLRAGICNDQAFTRKQKNEMLVASEELSRLKRFIDTLSEETNNGVDVTDFCKPIDPGIAQCVADHWWKMLDGKEPDKSLEEEAEKYASKYFVWNDDRDIAAYAFVAGAEWQRRHDMSDVKKSRPPQTGDSGCFQNGNNHSPWCNRIEMTKEDEK